MLNSHGSNAELAFGGALVDVLGAVAIAAMVLTLYSSVGPANDDEMVAEQVAWMQRVQVDAVNRALRANQQYLLSKLANPEIKLLDGLLPAPVTWGAYMPDGLKSTTANAWGQVACVMVRQIHTKNFLNQDVPTGTIEVVLSQLQNPLRTAAKDSLKSQTVLRNLVSKGIPAGYTKDTTSAQGNGFDVPSTIWRDEWKNCGAVAGALWSQWKLTSDGQTIVSHVNTEYLARYRSTEEQRWLQDMDTSMWLGFKGAGSNAPLANVHNLQNLAIQDRGANCVAETAEGYFAKSKDTPPQLLQCKSNSGIYQWLDASGVLASGNVLAGTLVVTSESVENNECNTELVGTLSRNVNGVPMVCTGRPGLRRWVRVGVPWAWVTEYKSLARNATTYTLDPDAVGIPSSATMLQLYIQGNTNAGQKGSIVVSETDKTTGKQISSGPVFEVPAYSSGPSVQGRPRLFGRQANSIYTFKMEGGTMSISLIGYSY